MKEKFPKIFGKPEPRPKKAIQPAPKPVPQSGNYPRKRFEPIISQSIELDKPAKEFIIQLHDADGEREIWSCYGDIYKVINALMDYARMLELVCDEWDLQGYHRAIYELHAEKLRSIAKKYQESIGYDYDAAVARCRAKKNKPHKDDDVGVDALELAMKKEQQKFKK